MEARTRRRRSTCCGRSPSRRWSLERPQTVLRARSNLQVLSCARHRHRDPSRGTLPRLGQGAARSPEPQRSLCATSHQPFSAARPRETLRKTLTRRGWSRPALLSPAVSSSLFAAPVGLRGSSSCCRPAERWRDGRGRNEEVLKLGRAREQDRGPVEACVRTERQSRGAPCWN